ncbi:pilus assembly protein TadG-related protein [Ruegeria atlantica]|uniref:pilus assembly protein TadG-related protein n=1 Tax=Ruegeria atlantica TaxID=81569 RepID=UPI00147C6FA4|nr:pilus assembly protein TadG-related protein [Ruegeria atlantica]
MFPKAIISRIAKDERGTIVVLWGTAFVAFLGFFAITMDVGRLSSTHAELQSFADNVAMAAAAELDGQPDALTRSANAAANLISRKQTFADGSKTLSGSTDFTLTFYSALPDSDLDPLVDDTTDPRQAKFAHVSLTPKSLSMNLASAVNKMVGGNGISPIDVTAEAVAGYAKAACDITPLMFCLPNDWENKLNVGDQILLRSGGGGSGGTGAAWGPGNFGFVDLAEYEDAEGACENEGGNQLACLIAAQEAITQCVLTNGFTTEPGQKEGITSAAFNTRFDIFQSVLNGDRNKEIYAPAPNVIKGKKGTGGNACIQGGTEDTGAIALGQDLCMAAGTCDTGNDRFGDGVWDRQAYLDANHGGVDTHLNAMTVPAGVKPNSRYEMYLQEIEYATSASNPLAPSILDPVNLDPNFPPETGRPICSNKMSSKPERRVVNAAGVDCSKTVIKGKTENVPVTKFVSVFLTEPVGEDGSSPPNFNIYGEVVGFPDVEGVGSGGAGFGGIFRDVVQLYR